MQGKRQQSIGWLVSDDEGSSSVLVLGSKVNHEMCEVEFRRTGIYQLGGKLWIVAVQIRTLLRYNRNNNAQHFQITGQFFQ